MRMAGRHCTAVLLALSAALQGCGGGSSNGGEPQPAPAPPAPPTPASGLDARPTNSTCIAWERAGAGSSIALSRFTSLSFARPIGLLQAPGDASRWYVIEQDGVVRSFAAGDPAASSVFADLSGRVASPADGAGGEMGLLGMAFHPDFPVDTRVFVSYTASEPRRSIISEFTASVGAAPSLDTGSERVLLTINQPEANHNGGHLAFGPDGLLYIGIGDGGGGGDAHGAVGNGQNLQTLLGKLLRIDVSDTSGAVRYRIPGANPFSGGAVCNTTGTTTAAQCAEIYAYGFRNPWRWSFDRESGALWLGDVGQNEWEEVNQVTLGGNYGWRCREGAHDFNTSACNMSGLIDPVAEYDHSQGASVTGGYVYRGAQSTGLFGRYLFGDFGSGRIWAWIAENAAQPRTPTLLLDSSVSISSFGEALDGELYVVDYGGPLYRIVFEGGDAMAPPATLSATGCVAQTNPQEPAAGLIPYTINAPFWSDGADKERWLALPDAGDITLASDGDFEFPPGAVLMKQFRLGERLVETRLFVRHPDGAWAGYSYEWNAQQTDATLVEGGAVRDINGQAWVFPSGPQCLECHTSAAGRTLGLESSQLNRPFTYEATGRTANQLLTLSHIGVLQPAVTDPAAQPALADPQNSAADLSARARAYLHTNCSQCHRPGGPTPGSMDLRFSTPLDLTNACDAAPTAGDLGLGANARLIAPGEPANSLIVNRMNRRDQHGMPPLASTEVDAAGAELIMQWVEGLAGCG